MYVDHDATLTIESTTISNVNVTANNEDVYGGVIYVSSNSAATIASSTIASIVAAASGVGRLIGGVLYLSGTSAANLTSTTITSVSSSTLGSGYVYGGVMYLEGIAARVDEPNTLLETKHRRFSGKEKKSRLSIYTYIYMVL